MSAPRIPLTGEALLTAVTTDLVDLHQRYFHRKPVSAKSQLLGDDMLACVMGGVYTDVEKTLIEIQKGAVVQEARSAFQNAMQHRFIDIVQQLSGREVEMFISNSHVGPDLEIEIFLLGPELAGAHA